MSDNVIGTDYVLILIMKIYCDSFGFLLEICVYFTLFIHISRVCKL